MHVAGVQQPELNALRFFSAFASRQHPIKRNLGMVDADAVEETPVLLGVCDGVSEVQKLGISPDELPRELLTRCRELLEAGAGAHSYPRNGNHWVTHLLEDAYDQTEAQGSTTLILATIEPDAHQLVIASLGDCNGLLLRPSARNPRNLEIAFRTSATRYEANKPKQVARLDGTTLDQVHAVIRDAQVDLVGARHGDVLILGSDGLFDNLYDEDMRGISERILTRSTTSARRSKKGEAPTASQLEEAADALISAALESVCIGQVDENGEVQWPETAKQTPIGLGGKADDTTAVVAFIMEVQDVDAHEEFYYEARAANRSRASWSSGLLPRCCGMASEEPHASKRSKREACEEGGGCSVS